MIERYIVYLDADFQPTATRLTFISPYGTDADQRWVDEHNRALGPQSGP